METAPDVMGMLVVGNSQELCELDINRYGGDELSQGTYKLRFMAIYGTLNWQQDSPQLGQISCHKRLSDLRLSTVSRKLRTLRAKGLACGLICQLTDGI